jgi:soluble lytic murein transglycosylase-like protein
MNEELPMYRYPAVWSCWIFLIVISMLVLHHINSDLKQSNSLICMFTIDETSPESPQVAAPENEPSYVRGKRAEQLFHPIVLEAANRHQIDPALVKAVIMAESSYNPRAISKRGAKGLMQLMPVTAKALGVEDSFNPEHNINAGVKYLRHLMNQFDGDTKLALAAYNAGSRKVRQYSGIPPFNATKYYIKKVFRYYKYYKEEMEAEVSRA